MGIGEGVVLRSWFDLSMRSLIAAVSPAGNVAAARWKRTEPVRVTEIRHLATLCSGIACTGRGVRRLFLQLLQPLQGGLVGFLLGLVGGLRLVLAHTSLSALQRVVSYLSHIRFVVVGCWPLP